MFVRLCGTGGRLCSAVVYGTVRYDSTRRGGFLLALEDLPIKTLLVALGSSDAMGACALNRDCELVSRVAHLLSKRRPTDIQVLGRDLNPCAQESVSAHPSSQSKLHLK